MVNQIESLRQEIEALKETLRCKEKLLFDLTHKEMSTNEYCNGLSAEDVTRYSRQMLVPLIGLSGQIALKNSKCLIVGAGGLGCPASVYLAAAGIGEITIVDYDEVEMSNLHRQILHTEGDLNIPKVDSAYNKLHCINSAIKILPIKRHIDSQSIKELLSKNKYNVVIDGTDNVATRYLLNDACVLNGVPLVSGSALQLEAQLTVYNYQGGPCYRCLFPVPPPPETVTSCGDGGVLGPVPGLTGVLQALEAIKVLTSSSEVLSGRLLLFDGASTTFRNVRLRPRNPKCAVCGDCPTIKDLIDYEQFCGAGAHDKVQNINILNDNEQVDVKTLKENLGTRIVLDVRPEIQYEICRLPHTINVSLMSIEKGKGVEKIKDYVRTKGEQSKNEEVYVLCRRGNDSQRAIKILNKQLSDLPIRFLNVKGGLHSYSKKIDSNFPVF